jgi:hypothetical protein
MTTKVKLAAAFALVAGALFVGKPARALAVAGDCVYGSERVWINGKVECLGSTELLCQGSSDCPKQHKATATEGLAPQN